MTLKRTFDVLASGIGLIAALPIIALAMVAVRLESPGSPLFAQTRVGRGQRPFTCYKLRTMYRDTAQLPTHMTERSSVTRVGDRLRRWKLDELPQLYNVLRGDMSLVGPRPCLPSQHELIEARQQRGVFDIRPGITGLAQVRGIDMSDPERLAEIDARYIATATFAGDLQLIIDTALGRGRGLDHVAGESRG